MSASIRPLSTSPALLLAACATLPAENPARFAQLELSRGSPLVMVMVNGRGPFRFVIDTGTGGQAFITPQLAAELQLPLAGRAQLTDRSRRGGQIVAVVPIQSTQVGGVEFTSVKAAEHALVGSARHT